MHTNLFDNVAGSEHHCTKSTKWGLRLFGHNPASHRLWAQRDRQIRRIRGCGFDLPGVECPSTYALGDNGTESADAEIDDEHTRNASASPLYIQEREANADLSQAYHSNEESLLPDARSILASTGELVAWLSQKRKSSQELDDGQIRNLLERQKERVLAENNIRELNRQIESQAMEIGHTRAGSWTVQMRTRSLSLRLGRSRKHFMKLVSEVFKRWKNWRVFKNYESTSFRETKLIEDQNTINELMARIQELQNEVNCMNDARDFKDAEPLHSGQLSHVPSQLALFPSPRGEVGGMQSRDRSLRPDVWNPHGISETFCWSTCECFDT